MALEWNRFVEPDPSDGYVVAKERLCLTEDDRLVVEGDPAGRWLYCIPGHRIPRAEAAKYGLLTQPEREEPVSEVADDEATDELVDDDAAEEAEPAKARRAPANKSRRPAGDK